MPETKKKATARAKKVGIPTENVVKTEKGYFIAPAGSTAKGKKVYAGCRAKGGKKDVCAAVSHKIGGTKGKKK